ncbi:MAG TPA: ESX secretion-associated protein EspG [Actinophytocola sp.]|jgi:hypothetical protein|uniref:ESX secretion-associated protein EspG n=1 Tax=Actinophytocola sp. TaxID=1872138 RepID=UPI002DF8DFED|nr:ESX secretion-associated protein EspG [Actinophytocola sp.]
MAGPYLLSPAAVDVLSQTLNVNLRLFPFEIPSFGRMQADRVGIARAVFADLAGRGLITDGDLEPDLVRALRTLAHFQVAVVAMGLLEKDRKLFARVSAAGETGVLAEQEGERLRVELIRPTALAVTLVALLPKVEAGPGQSVTLSKPAPVAVGASDEYLTEVHGRPADITLRIAEGYLNRPRTGSGFFAVLGKDRYGREFRAGEVGWFDTDAGRYLNLSRPPGDDGQVHGTFSPADQPRLTRALSELIDAAAPRS